MVLEPFEFEFVVKWTHIYYHSSSKGISKMKDFINNNLSKSNTIRTFKHFPFKCFIQISSPDPILFWRIYVICISSYSLTPEAYFMPHSLKLTSFEFFPMFINVFQIYTTNLLKIFSFIARSFLRVNLVFFKIYFNSFKIFYIRKPLGV